MGVISLELENETICPLKLRSTADLKRSVGITLGVNNRISTVTPKRSFLGSIKRNSVNFIQADKSFNVSGLIDIVLGIYIYSRITLDGIYNKPGLPTAQNTIFEIVLYGTFHR